jgi:cysteinyl-tRNA synthetase
MFQTHYRQKLDLTDEGLAASQEASRRLGEFQNRLRGAMAESDSPRFTNAAQRLRQDFAEALNDDLNAPRAVAAMFAFMNEGHSAMDVADRPGPAAVLVWEQAEGVLDVASKVLVLKVKAGAGNGDDQGELSKTPPADPLAAERWARDWAARRARHKTARNYAEADRIRGLLREAGWDVRDNKDGSGDVVRTSVGVRLGNEGR